MNDQKTIKPTESELEILAVIWDKQKATVREVHEETHIYEALVSKEKTQKQLVDKMVNSLFGGSATQLVMQTLGNNSPSADELIEIQKLLDNLKKH